MRSRLARIALLLVACAALLFVVPPLGWAARDLWLLARAPEREQAVAIIVGSISAGARRALDSAHLASAGEPVGNPPMMSYQPQPDPARDIGTCAHIPAARSFPSRRSAIEAARLASFAERTSNPRLVALSACTNATPFAASCGRAFLRSYLRGGSLAPFLERLGAARVANGRACWLLPPDGRR